MDRLPTAIVAAREDEILTHGQVFYGLVKPTKKMDGLESTAAMVNVIPKKRIYVMDKQEELHLFMAELTKRPLVLQPSVFIGRGIAKINLGVCSKEERWGLLINQAHPKVLGRIQMGINTAMSRMERGEPFVLEFSFNKFLKRIYLQRLSLSSRNPKYTFVDFEHAEIVIRYPGDFLHRTMKWGLKTRDISFSFEDLLPTEIVRRTVEEARKEWTSPALRILELDELMRLMPGWRFHEEDMLELQRAVEESEKGAEAPPFPDDVPDEKPKKIVGRSRRNGPVKVEVPVELHAPRGDYDNDLPRYEDLGVMSHGQQYELYHEQSSPIYPQGSPRSPRDLRGDPSPRPRSPRNFREDHSPRRADHQHDGRELAKHSHKYEALDPKFVEQNREYGSPYRPSVSNQQSASSLNKQTYLTDSNLEQSRTRQGNKTPSYGDRQLPRPDARTPSYGDEHNLRQDSRTHEQDLRQGSRTPSYGDSQSSRSEFQTPSFNQQNLRQNYRDRSSSYGDNLDSWQQGRSPSYGEKQDSDFEDGFPRYDSRQQRDSKYQIGNSNQNRYDRPTALPRGFNHRKQGSGRSDTSACDSGYGGDQENGYDLQPRNKRNLYNPSEDGGTREKLPYVNPAYVHDHDSSMRNKEPLVDNIMAQHRALAAKMLQQDSRTSDSYREDDYNRGDHSHREYSKELQKWTNNISQLGIKAQTNQDLRPTQSEGVEESFI